MAKKNKVDARALKAAKLVIFAATSPDPENQLSILDAIQARKYSKEEAHNRTLQMQVCCLVEHLINPDATTSASTVSPVPPVAAAPVAASTAAPTKPPAKKSTTFQANVDAPSDLCPLPKISPLKATMKTTTQTHNEGNKKKKIDQLCAVDLKRSTTWYAV